MWKMPPAISGRERLGMHACSTAHRRVRSQRTTSSRPPHNSGTGRGTAVTPPTVGTGAVTPTAVTATAVSPTAVIPTAVTPEGLLYGRGDSPCTDSTAADRPVGRDDRQPGRR